MLGGSILTLGSDIYEKSGSSGRISLDEVAGFGNSCTFREFITSMLNVR